VRTTGARVGAESINNRLVERFPLLDLGASVETVVDEIPLAVGALRESSVPGPLKNAGRTWPRALEASVNIL